MASSERWGWEEQCDTLLCEAIAALGKYNGSLDTTKWKAVGTRGQVTVSRHIDEDTNSVTSTRLAGTGYIHGRLEDITRGLYCDTDDDLIGNEAVLSGEPVLDGAVLQVLEKRGANTPFRFAGVKWVATNCGAVTRELLTFERMGMTLDSDNTEVAYHIVYAIPDHLDWPTPAQLCAVSSIYRQRKAPVGIPRLEPFALCYLYRKVSDDLVLCFILGEYWGQATGNLQRESEHVLAQRVLMVSNALVCCEAKILTKMLDHCKDAPVQQSKTCLRCRSTRGTVMDPLRICGICRKSVCSTCLSLKTTSRLNPRTQTAETEAFCLRCLIRANIPTTPSDEPRLGLRNAENDRIERRQRRELQHQHHHHHHHDRRLGASELRPRDARAHQKVAKIAPPHAYNYDGLIRNRANSRSSSSSRDSEDQRREKGGATVRTIDPSGGLNTRRQDDLYLRGSFLNQASSEAERRYQLHLERDKRLSAPVIRDFSATARPTPQLRHSSSIEAERRYHRHLERVTRLGMDEYPEHSLREYSSRPSLQTQRPPTAPPGSPKTMRDQKSVREFYRDLYSEL